MHIIKITPNLIFEYQCTSGKFIRLPNRIEKIDSVAKIESKFFLPELECSTGWQYRGSATTIFMGRRDGCGSAPPALACPLPRYYCRDVKRRRKKRGKRLKMLKT